MSLDVHKLDSIILAPRVEQCKQMYNHILVLDRLTSRGAKAVSYPTGKIFRNTWRKEGESMPVGISEDDATQAW